MKKTIFLVLFLVVFGGAIFNYKFLSPAEKVYVAVEGEGTIAVINAVTNKLYRTIDLTMDHEGGKLKFSPHNVQVAPNGETVWVTANSGKHQHAQALFPVVFAHGDGEEVGDDADQVIVINPKSDQIIKRLSIGRGVQLAHVTLTPDSNYAYVTAQKEGAIYKIDAKNFTVVKEIIATDGSEPHGLRVSPNGQEAYVAMLKSWELGLLDLTTDALLTRSVNGGAVQAGVLPNGRVAFVSLYDTKQLAVYDVDSGEIKNVVLGINSKGPVQMYTTPDSRFVYLADQGYYFGEPTSDLVYKLDTETWRVVKEIKAGQAPHGVVVSPNGSSVYVTNLLSGDVSLIDVATDVELLKIPVGKEPNGISFWSKTLGGTP